jgi:acetolactate synthase-1/2/3 large subunit
MNLAPHSVLRWANRDAGGRLSVAIMGDGEPMMNPGALWTAAHHKIPILWVIHNNRGRHQEQMRVQRMANRHGGISRVALVTTMTNPNLDFSKIAQGMGVWSAVSVFDPELLKPSLQNALNVVRGGEPALVDVIVQRR